MFIIEIIPIGRGISTDSLSYFTSKQIPIGSVVNIPLRKKVVSGIVISTTKASDMKGEIKSADFTLKKIEGIKSSYSFIPEFMEMVREVAEYYATSPGSVLNILLPKYILSNINKLEGGAGQTKKTSSIHERYAVQGDNDERYSTWKGLIRQEFARGKSIMFILPTIEDTSYIYSLISKGIEEYSFILHGSITPKKIVDTWNNIMKEKHPVVIVATGGFLSIPRNDIETIVLESENSRSYKIQSRPHLDIRNVCEIFAQKKGVKIFFSDILLRIETLWRESENEIVQATPFKFRSLSTTEDTLVDMKSYKSSGSAFTVVSDEVKDMILSTKNNSEHMIILATRRGLSPNTVCGDCQTIVTCNKCSTPVVLHSKDGKNFFMCHRCGDRRSSEEYCKNCGSWKLGLVGIGIDLVYQTITTEYPDVTVFKIDSDSVKGEKNIRNTIQKFRSKPGSILIGT
jgi:primosomal protein N' (replication factor Y)